MARTYRGPGLATSDNGVAKRLKAGVCQRRPRTPKPRHLSSTFERAERPLHAALAFVEGLRQGGGGPGLPIVQQRQNRVTFAVGGRAEHTHSLAARGAEHEAVGPRRNLGQRRE